MAKQPWDDCPEVWKSEQAYMQWLRSQTRRVWSRHPIKLEYKKQRRYKAPVGRNGKEVWVSDCEMCGCQSRKCEVDHLDGGYGFSNWEEYTQWAKRILWVTFSDVRELCKVCHEAVTLSQRKNISIDEAKIEKVAIAFGKCSVDTQKELLEGEGIDPSLTSNAKKRREAFKGLVTIFEGHPCHITCDELESKLSK